MNRHEQTANPCELDPRTCVSQSRQRDVSLERRSIGQAGRAEGAEGGRVARALVDGGANSGARLARGGEGERCYRLRGGWCGRGPMTHTGGWRLWSRSGVGGGVSESRGGGGGGAEEGEGTANGSDGEGREWRGTAWRGEARAGGDVAEARVS